MKKFAVVFASAALGVVFSLAFVWLSQALGISVRFPSPGGEDDFSVRASYFFFGVCPAFFLLGAWIGRAGVGNARKWSAMWGGVVLGTAVVFGVARLLQSQIDLLTKDGAANWAVLLLDVAWVLASGLSALMLRRLASILVPAGCRHS